MKNNIIFSYDEMRTAGFYMETDSKAEIALQIMEEQRRGGYKYLSLWDLMDMISWSCEKAGFQALFRIKRTEER